MKTKVVVLVILFLSLTMSNIFSQVHEKKKTPFTSIQKKLDEIVEKDLMRGVSVYIKHPNKGIVNLVSGYSNYEDKIKLKENNIFALASIGKTFAATAAMLMVEEGKFQLDDFISKYLPCEIIDSLPNADKVTIRQLLNMTSGFLNYERVEELNSLYLSGGLKLDTVSHLSVLQQYVYNKPAINFPGEKYYYSSTNYILLGMIMDKVLGYPHKRYYEEKIFKPIKLKNTFYKETPPNNHTETYGDLNSDGILENITNKTTETTNWFTCDDGMYSTAQEVGYFLELLLKGKIVSEKSLTEMKKWVMPDNLDYGLGLMYDKSFPYKETIGHSGNGIGTATAVYFFPKQDITVAILSNTGKRVGDKKYRKAYYQLLNKIAFKLFLF